MDDGFIWVVIGLTTSVVSYLMHIVYRVHVDDKEHREDIRQSLERAADRLREKNFAEFKHSISHEVWAKKPFKKVMQINREPRVIRVLPLYRPHAWIQCDKEYNENTKSISNHRSVTDNQHDTDTGPGRD